MTILTDDERQKLPAPQQAVPCAECADAHAILDSDDSQIIRNAKDGYPDGRAPQVLTLAERVSALCTYAADWKRWCLEKESAPQQDDRQRGCCKNTT